MRSLVSLLLLGAAQEPPAAARIERLGGPRATITVGRATADRPALLLQNLLPGDIVQLGDPANVVLLRLASGDTIHICHPEASERCDARAPFRVSAPARGHRGVFAAIGEEILRWLTTEDERVEAGRSVQAAVNRGFDDVIYVPVWSRQAPRVIGGSRRLVLAWAGGRPPYAAVVRRVSDHREVAGQTGLPDRAFDLIATLGVGDHELTIDDAGGTRWRHRFTVIPAGPGLPTPEVDDSLGVEVVRLLRLGRREAGVYRWEAALQAAERRAGWPGLRGLGDALMRGEALPRLESPGQVQ